MCMQFQLDVCKAINSENSLQDYKPSDRAKLPNVTQMSSMSYRKHLIMWSIIEYAPAWQSGLAVAE